jgi:hypothetical protein
MPAKSEDPVFEPGELKPSRLAPIRFVPIAVLAIVFVLFDMLMATAIELPGDDQATIMLGGAFAQITLLAVWAALGPATVFKRLATSLIAISLVALAVVVSIDSWKGLWLAMVTTQWLTIQAPLWVLRLAFGWRLSWPNESIDKANRDDVQFGIRQLMAWTGLVGVTLGVARWLLPEDLSNLGGNPRHAAIIFGVLSVFNSLLAWPVVWAALMRSRAWAWLIVALFCCIGLTLAEIATFDAATGRRGSVYVVWVMNSLQFVTTAVGLLLVRLAGFRLVRVSKPLTG